MGDHVDGCVDGMRRVRDNMGKFGATLQSLSHSALGNSDNDKRRGMPFRNSPIGARKTACVIRDANQLRHILEQVVNN